MKFRIFKRTWWEKNTDGTWPNDLEPCAGVKKFVTWAQSEEAAREICRDANDDLPAHNPLSLMYEFERVA